MPTDDERREVAANCYEAAYRELFTGENVARAIGTHTSGTTRYDHDAWMRLKSLVEPAHGYSEITPKSSEVTAKCDRCGSVKCLNVVLDVDCLDGEWPDFINVYRRAYLPYRKYTPGDDCRLVYDPVHHDYYCTKCGEWFFTGAYEACDADDHFVYKDFRFCPNCGAKVVES